MALRQLTPDEILGFYGSLASPPQVATEQPPVPVEPVAPPQQSAFSPGFRSGVDNLLAGTGATVGRIQETLGGSDNGYYQAAQGMMDRSAQENRQIGGFRDVLQGKESFGNWAMHGMGNAASSALPSAALATGGYMVGKRFGLGKQGAVLGSLLTNTLQHAGEQVMNQQADPTIAALPVAERNRVAAPAVAVNAALDTVPEVLGAKAILKPSSVVPGFGKRVMSGVKTGLGATGKEGLTEGAQDVVSQAASMQLNPNQKFDAGQVLDNAAAGFIGAGPFAAPQGLRRMTAKGEMPPGSIDLDAPTAPPAGAPGPNGPSGPNGPVDLDGGPDNFNDANKSMWDKIKAGAADSFDGMKAFAQRMASPEVDMEPVTRELDAMQQRVAAGLPPQPHDAGSFASVLRETLSDKKFNFSQDRLDSVVSGIINGAKENGELNIDALRQRTLGAIRSAGVRTDDVVTDAVRRALDSEAAAQTKKAVSKVTAGIKQAAKKAAATKAGQVMGAAWDRNGQPIVDGTLGVVDEAGNRVGGLAGKIGEAADNYIAGANVLDAFAPGTTDKISQGLDTAKQAVGEVAGKFTEGAQQGWQQAAGAVTHQAPEAVASPQVEQATPATEQPTRNQQAAEFDNLFDAVAVDDRLSPEQQDQLWNLDRNNPEHFTHLQNVAAALESGQPVPELPQPLSGKFSLMGRNTPARDDVRVQAMQARLTPEGARMVTTQELQQLANAIDDILVSGRGITPAQADALTQLFGRGAHDMLMDLADIQDGDMSQLGMDRQAFQGADEQARADEAGFDDGTGTTSLEYDDGLTMSDNGRVFLKTRDGEQIMDYPTARKLVEFQPQDDGNRYSMVRGGAYLQEEVAPQNRQRVRRSLLNEIHGQMGDEHYERYVDDIATKYVAKLLAEGVDPTDAQRAKAFDHAEDTLLNNRFFVSQDQISDTSVISDREWSQLRSLPDTDGNISIRLADGKTMRVNPVAVTRLGFTRLSRKGEGTGYESQSRPDDVLRAFTSGLSAVLDDPAVSREQPVKHVQHGATSSNIGTAGMPAGTAKALGVTDGLGIRPDTVVAIVDGQPRTLADLVAGAQGMTSAEAPQERGGQPGTKYESVQHLYDAVRQAADRADAAVADLAELENKTRGDQSSYAQEQLQKARDWARTALDISRMMEKKKLERYEGGDTTMLEGHVSDGAVYGMGQDGRDAQHIRGHVSRQLELQQLRSEYADEARLAKRGSAEGTRRNAAGNAQALENLARDIKRDAAGDYTSQLPKTRQVKDYTPTAPEMGKIDPRDGIRFAKNTYGFMGPLPKEKPPAPLVRDRNNYGARSAAGERTQLERMSPPTSTDYWGEEYRKDDSNPRTYEEDTGTQLPAYGNTKASAPGTVHNTPTDAHSRKAASKLGVAERDTRLFKSEEDVTTNSFTARKPNTQVAGAIIRSAKRWLDDVREKKPTPAEAVKQLANQRAVAERAYGSLRAAAESEAGLKSPYLRALYAKLGEFLGEPTPAKKSDDSKAKAPAVLDAQASEIYYDTVRQALREFQTTAAGKNGMHNWKLPWLDRSVEWLARSGVARQQKVAAELLALRERLATTPEGPDDGGSGGATPTATKTREPAMAEAAKTSSTRSAPVEKQARKTGLGDIGARFPKDQAKADEATAFIGRGAPGSSTDKYMRAISAEAANKPVTGDDTVFVSVNGSRRGAVPFKVIQSQVQQAVDVGAKILADNAYHRMRDYNTGERELATFLKAAGYQEHQTADFSVWTPAPKKADAGAGSFSHAGVNAAPLTEAQRKEIEAKLKELVGKVRVIWKDDKSFAGHHRFDEKQARHVITLSLYAPDTVAFHEAMHAWVSEIGKTPEGRELLRPLYEAAGTKRIADQLKYLLRDEPAALKQLGNAEERIAYMYQFWAAGALQGGPRTDTLLGKIKNLISRVAGWWTSEQRAEDVMKFLHSGDYAAGRQQISAVLKHGRPERLAAVVERMAPVVRVWNKVWDTSVEQLQKTNIPALQRLADLMHTNDQRGGMGRGYLQKLQVTRGLWTSEFAKAVRGATEEQSNEALRELRGGEAATDEKAKAIVQSVRGLLEKVYKYAQEKGVEFKHRENYFPRMWDKEKVADNYDAFVSMLQKYGQTKTEAIGTADAIIFGRDKLAESTPPGYSPYFGSMNERQLPDIKAADAAPFLNSTLEGTMVSYLDHAAKRVEYQAQFGEGGKKIKALLERAKEQGATEAELADAKAAVMAMEGTLAPNANPKLRQANQWIITYQNVRLLPLTIMAQVGDLFSLAARRGEMKTAFTAFKQAMKDLPGWWSDDPKKSDAMRTAELFGVLEDKALEEVAGTYFSTEMDGLPRKINDAFFKYNCIDGWSRSLRSSATEAALSFIEEHTKNAKDAHSREMLTQLGLTPMDVNMLDGKLVRDPANRKLVEAVHHFVSEAVQSPSPALRPVWFSDPRFAAISHLKQFIYAFHHGILSYATTQAEEGNHKPMLILSSSLPFIMAAMYTKALASNGGELPKYMEEWSWYDWLYEGFTRTGLPGLFGISPKEMLLGPTGQQLLDIGSAAKEGHIGSELAKALPGHQFF